VATTTIPEKKRRGLSEDAEDAEELMKIVEDSSCIEPCFTQQRWEELT
jgi:hypothetical protein